MSQIERKKETVRVANHVWPHQFQEEVGPELIGQVAGANWLLVEESTINGKYHLSLHMDMDMLSYYQTQQEHAEDWMPLVAINLSEQTVVQLNRGYTISFGEMSRLPQPEVT